PRPPASFGDSRPCSSISGRSAPQTSQTTFPFAPPQARIFRSLFQEMVGNAPARALESPRHQHSRRVLESKGNILIVDDEPSICTVICDYLRLQGYNCASANAVDSALQILQTVSGIDCILSDIKMPGRTGIDLLKEVKTNWPEMAVILFTGNAEIHTAVASMQEGAYDFILKPIQLKQVIHSITNALEKKRMKL